MLAVVPDRPNQRVILLLTIYNSTSPTLLSVLLHALMEAFTDFSGQIYVYTVCMGSLEGCHSHRSALWIEEQI